VDGGMLWRSGCDGKALRCGAGNRHQHIQAKPRGRVQIPLLVAGPDGTAINM
jgi:hypothetical protein